MYSHFIFLLPVNYIILQSFHVVLQQFHGHPSYTPSDGTEAQLQAWLAENHFGPDIQVLLAGYTQSDLLNFSKSDAKRILGVKTGRVQVNVCCTVYYCT